MPKMKESKQDVKKNNLKADIDCHRVKMGKTKGEMAKFMGAKLGIHPNTYSRKSLHPEDFTYLELMKVFDILNFSQEEKMECI